MWRPDIGQLLPLFVARVNHDKRAGANYLDGVLVSPRPEP